MSESPTAATTRRLRDQQIRYCITEHFHAPTMTRRDLFGFADVVALDPKNGIVAIQCCKTNDQAARKAKILKSNAAKEWLECGGKIEVWGWNKYADKIDRKQIRCTVTEITLEDFRGSGVKNIFAKHWQEDPA